jgi:uncharacterized protein (DUF362 family)
MSQSNVAIAKGADPSANVKSVLEQAGIGDVCRDKKVIIKMNLSGGPSDKPGAVISRETTQGLVEYLKPFCSSLMLADGGRGSAEETWELFREKTWAAELAEEMGIELVNLWEGHLEEVPIPQPKARNSWSIPNVLLDADIVASLAVMKVSAITTATLAMKNFFGVIPVVKKYRLHDWIDEIIVDLVQALKPGFGVIDGYYGWEAGESILGGHAIKSDVVLASTDLVALDTVGAAVMGYDPSLIEHIQLAAKVGLGTANLNEIEVRGTSLAEVQMNFPPPPSEHLFVPNAERKEKGIEAELARA